MGPLGKDIALKNLESYLFLSMMIIAAIAIVTHHADLW